MNSVLESNGKFNFTKTERQIFSNNLILIDSKLPEILSQLVYEFYSSKKSKIVDLIKVTRIKNPLKFDTSNEHQFYEYKIKRFLTDVALGMMPSKVWAGQYDATGGYLIVKENGDILCYHIYNRNEFENYLFNNTKLETASSNRHGFGSIYEENGEFYFKLNLQIRFL
jgi:type II restriction enzyme